MLQRRWKESPNLLDGHSYRNRPSAIAARIVVDSARPPQSASFRSHPQPLVEQLGSFSSQLCDSLHIGDARPKDPSPELKIDVVDELRCAWRG
jgi:hypothetical protein